MKRLSTIMMCLLAMMAASLSAKAQEVTITLFPGWNWISYPKAETQDISTALGDFEPVNGDMLKSQFGNAVYSNGYWRGSVTHFIPGWGYKYYSNRSEMVSFVFGEAAPQLTVTTVEPTEITATSAISGGSVTSNDGSFVLMKGICWATHPYPIANDDYHTEDGSGTGSFTVSMTDLSPNTTYYVRAYALSLNGLTYGEQYSFTTTASLPMVTTSQVTTITQTSAIGGGNVIDSGGATVTERGICWSTSHNPTTSGSHANNGTGTGTFTVNMTGLTPNTTYYVRAYAINSAGTSYGTEISFTTLQAITFPTVITSQVTNIQQTTATGGGNVTSSGGANITERGICWSKSHNPTTSDSHDNSGTGTGTFTVNMTSLMANTTYYVRAYATNSAGTGYGNEVQLTTLPSVSTHEYVDLGLPSGLLWATCNVGADLPEEYGDYFAWGETQPKSTYDWSTYQYCNGSNFTLTKYCNSSSYGYNGFTDNLTILLYEDDAAAANWGCNWRMPTYDEWVELYQNTTMTWTTQNGVIGRLFTASNGNSLFLPCAGFRDGNAICNAGNFGGYWSSSLISYGPSSAWYFYVGTPGLENTSMTSSYRYYGHSVRAVCSSQN